MGRACSRRTLETRFLALPCPIKKTFRVTNHVVIPGRIELFRSGVSPRARVGEQPVSSSTRAAKDKSHKNPGGPEAYHDESDDRQASGLCATGDIIGCDCVTVGKDESPECVCVVFNQYSQN